MRKKLVINKYEYYGFIFEVMFKRYNSMNINLNINNIYIF